MYYFYVAQSEKDRTFYYGITSDLRQRIKDHNLGKTPSIKKKIPYRIVYYEAYNRKTFAIKRELHIKKSGKERKNLLKRLHLK